jgi:hypothetical protein
VSSSWRPRRLSEARYELTDVDQIMVSWPRGRLYSFTNTVDNGRSNAYDTQRVKEMTLLLHILVFLKIWSQNTIW